MSFPPQYMRASASNVASSTERSAFSYASAAVSYSLANAYVVGHTRSNDLQTKASRAQNTRD